MESAKKAGAQTTTSSESKETPLKIRPQKLKKLVPECITQEVDYDPRRPRHKDMIIEHIDEQVNAVEMDRRLQVWKLLLCWLCMLSNIAGVTLALLGLAMTPLFDKYKPNPLMFFCSFLLYIPFLAYVKIVFFPRGNEWSLRKYISKARKWRQYVFSEQRRIYLGKPEREDDDDESGLSGLFSASIRRKSMSIRKSASFTNASDSRKVSSPAMAMYKASIKASSKQPSVGERTQSILVTAGSKKASAGTEKRIAFQV